MTTTVTALSSQLQVIVVSTLGRNPPQKEDQVGLARPIPIAIVVVHYKHIVVVVVAGPSQSQLAVYYVPEEAQQSLLVGSSD